MFKLEGYPIRFPLKRSYRWKNKKRPNGMLEKCLDTIAHVQVTVNTTDGGGRDGEMRTNWTEFEEEELIA